MTNFDSKTGKNKKLLKRSKTNTKLLITKIISKYGKICKIKCLIYFTYLAYPTISYASHKKHTNAINSQSW